MKLVSLHLLVVDGPTGEELFVMTKWTWSELGLVFCCWGRIQEVDSGREEEFCDE